MARLKKGVKPEKSVPVTFNAPERTAKLMELAALMEKYGNRSEWLNAIAKERIDQVVSKDLQDRVVPLDE